MSWGDLTLQFSDESNVTTGRRHFFSYLYGPTFGAEIAPGGLEDRRRRWCRLDRCGTDGRPTRRSSSTPATTSVGPNFFINEGLGGFLTGVDPTDTVRSFLGGQGCGE